jgi:phage terminase small subunit
MFRKMRLDPIEAETRVKPADPTSNLHLSYLTEMQLRFVSAWTGNLIAAARTAGYSNPRVAAHKLMKDPNVVEALQKKQEAMLQESGEHLARTLPLSRADVIDRLWQLAQLSPERTNHNIGGQVKAAEALERVFALNIDKNDLLKRQLEGKSESDVEFFVIHGFLPHEGQKPVLETPAEVPQLPEPTRSSESIVSTGSIESTRSTADSGPLHNEVPHREPAIEVAEPVAQ